MGKKKKKEKESRTKIERELIQEGNSYVRAALRRKNCESFANFVAAEQGVQKLCKGHQLVPNYTTAQE